MIGKHPKLKYTWFFKTPDGHKNRTKWYEDEYGNLIRK